MMTHNVAPTREHGSECGHRLEHFSTTSIPRIPRSSSVVVVHAIPTRCQSSSKHTAEFQTRALQAAHSRGKIQQTAARRCCARVRVMGANWLYETFRGYEFGDKHPSLRTGKFLRRVGVPCVLGYHNSLNTLR